jgi:hypothetical protein
VLTVEPFCDAHERHEVKQPDPAGTGTGDDGENRDSSY